ncbi:DNA-directed RNA polymerase subunit beta' [Patescibacteria group bacterium]|nr:DNA-directed RNA polymerase subunit beta' [Patescibacteria group bacterium]
MDQKRGKVADTTQFDWIGLKVASPEKILEWSWGEVRKPETINYRTQRAEKNGLFDEAVFGPEKDYECYCGKYKGPRFRGIVCEKCSVEVTRAIVRRERMGHIELSSPVAHIWFLRSVPSRIALVLGISALDAEKVIYFAGYIVTKIVADEKQRILDDLDAEFRAKSKALTNEKAVTELKALLTAAKADVERIRPGVVLDELEYHRFTVKYGTFFEAGIGAEAIYSIFKSLNLEALAKELEKELEEGSDREKVSKRLSLIKSMIQAGIRPEWMFLTRIPVTPPALRPMVALESGRHATSDVNDLYRRVINRNNRLQKLRDIRAPEVILRNEKRILQEAVDALIDNSIRRGQAAGAQSAQTKRPLKSLADYLKAKQGYFRFNLLGKRVDYSGRSVIVVGPDLELDQCGLPKHMALELFRPFIISKLIERELAFNIRGAGRLVEEGIPEVWAILEEVISGRHVLLNRAPTLHRQGIQAFRPVLIEGNAIQLHPLVCQAFNADFDGDQMAVHVPLSDEAQLEAEHILSANKNVLKPGSGLPVVSVDKDITLGIFWMTRLIAGAPGEGKYFSSPNAAILSYDFGDVSLQAKVSVLPTPGKAKYAAMNGERFETTVGRLLFNSILPADYPYINEEVKKGSLSKIVEDMIRVYGLDRVPPILDRIKEFGFTFATKSGVSFSAHDVRVPKEKEGIIAAAQQEAHRIQEEYANGLLTAEEKKRLIIEIWQNAKGQLEKYTMASLDPRSSISTMVVSGARGSAGNVTEMIGMKGLMQNTRGEVIEFPVISSMKEGMTPIEYFTTTHGARKGLSDTALKTAAAGYLTRRLFDVAQDLIITEADCGTKKGITIHKLRSTGMEADLAKLIAGRVLLKAVEVDGRTLKRGTLLSTDDARIIAAAQISEVDVRSPMSCETQGGICQACYGSDLATRHMIDLGEAIGTIAAQAIGEPGTQLTMRTFHAGGSATVGGDITHGLPRVEEIFDKRPPKGTAMLSAVTGEVIEVREEAGVKTIVILPDVGSEGASKTRDRVEYPVPARRVAIVKAGAKVVRGQALTDGSANLDELFELAGASRLQEYMIDEVSKIYDLQGASVSHKHMEVIIRQMFSRARIKVAGDTGFVKNDIVELAHLLASNRQCEEAGREPATYEQLVLGITEVSLNRKSFLSAASFQHTTRTLITAAMRGSVDTLKGLKENVIIGRSIPAGTGYAGSEKNKMIREFQDDRARRDAERAAAYESEAERARDIA